MKTIKVTLSNERLITPSPLDTGLVPVDIDVTPMDNSKAYKEGVSRTYKGYDGYAPIMAYIGTEGYLANTELREGKQEWLDKIKDCCQDVRHPREGKTVYIGSSWKEVSYTDAEESTKTITMRIVYEVIERMSLY